MCIFCLTNDRAKFYFTNKLIEDHLNDKYKPGLQVDMHEEYSKVKSEETKNIF